MKVNYVCISRNCVAYCLITGFADIATGIHDQRSEYELPCYKEVNNRPELNKSVWLMITKW